MRLLMQLDLPGAGLSGDEEVGHRGEVQHVRPARDVPAEADLERVGRLPGLGRREDVAQRHELALLVRHLDADRAAARDGRQDAHVRARHRVRDVVAQAGDAIDLDARRELELVARHGGADGHADEARVDTEVAQRRLEDLAALLDDATVHLLRGAALQQVARRQGPVPVAVGREVDRHLTLVALTDRDVGRRVDDLRGQRRRVLVVEVGRLDDQRRRRARRPPRPPRRRLLRLLVGLGVDQVDLGDRLDGGAPRWQRPTRRERLVVLVRVREVGLHAVAPQVERVDHEGRGHAPARGRRR